MYLTTKVFIKVKIFIQGSPAQYSESPAGSGENPGSGRSKEGRRVRLRPHPSLQEANKRSIVVPKVTRALSRTFSEQPRSCPGQSGPAANSGVAAGKKALLKMYIIGQCWLYGFSFPCALLLNVFVLCREWCYCPS